MHARPLRTKHGWRIGIEGPGCAGWPDIIAVHPGQHRVLVAELKSRRGRLSADQAAWLDMLAAAGVECYVWRAGVDTLQTIVEVLQQDGSQA